MLAIDHTNYYVGLFRKGDYVTLTNRKGTSQHELDLPIRLPQFYISTLLSSLVVVCSTFCTSMNISNGIYFVLCMILFFY